jgi:hypothetical protein
MRELLTDKASHPFRVNGRVTLTHYCRNAFTCLKDTHKYSQFIDLNLKKMYVYLCLKNTFYCYLLLK